MVHSNSSPVGRLAWIGLRPAARQPMLQTDAVACHPEFGLHGDCYHKRSGNRQVTIIQFESLRELAKRLQRNTIAPELLRRNLALSGGHVAALIGREFTIGEVRLLGTDDCPPCGRMNETLGTGGRDAMQGLGGITARILLGGTIRIGDGVTVIDHLRES